MPASISAVGVPAARRCRLTTAPEHARHAALLGEDVARVGDQDGHEDAQRRVVWRSSPCSRASRSPSPTATPPAASRRTRGARRRRERAVTAAAERDAIGDERRAVVDHRLALDQPPHPGGRAEARERRARGHGVRGTDDRAEHERGLPAHAGHDRVRHHRDGGHRRPAPARPPAARAAAPRPAARAGPSTSRPSAAAAAGRRGRRRPGSSSRSGSPGTSPIASPPATRTIGNGHGDKIGQPDAQGGGQQQEEQELDVAQRAREL